MVSRTSQLQAYIIILLSKAYAGKNQRPLGLASSSLESDRPPNFPNSTPLTPRMHVCRVSSMIPEVLFLVEQVRP